MGWFLLLAVFLFVFRRIRGLRFCAAKVVQSRDCPSGRHQKPSEGVVMLESGMSGTDMSVPQFLNARGYSGGIETRVGKLSQECPAPFAVLAPPRPFRQPLPHL